MLREQNALEFFKPDMHYPPCALWFKSSTFFLLSEYLRVARIALLQIHL